MDSLALTLIFLAFEKTFESLTHFYYQLNRINVSKKTITIAICQGILNPTLIARRCTACTNHELYNINR